MLSPIPNKVCRCLLWSTAVLQSAHRTFAYSTLLPSFHRAELSDRAIPDSGRWTSSIMRTKYSNIVRLKLARALLFGSHPMAHEFWHSLLMFPFPTNSFHTNWTLFAALRRHRDTNWPRWNEQTFIELISEALTSVRIRWFIHELHWHIEDHFVDTFARTCVLRDATCRARNQLPIWSGHYIVTTK